MVEFQMLYAKLALLILEMSKHPFRFSNQLEIFRLVHHVFVEEREDPNVCSFMAKAETLLDILKSLRLFVQQERK